MFTGFCSNFLTIVACPVLTQNIMAPPRKNFIAMTCKVAFWIWFIEWEREVLSIVYHYLKALVVHESPVSFIAEFVESNIGEEKSEFQSVGNIRI